MYLAKDPKGSGMPRVRKLLEYWFINAQPPLTPVRHCGNRRQLAWPVLVVVLGMLGCPPAFSQDVSSEQMKGLDEQVQEIKSDVLSIAAELSLLEEKLLYPSDTHVAVFVALARGETMRLDAVSIQIDGASVAHHIYSFKELEALQKGGVQRIYTGNLPVGEHQLEVSIAGKLAEDKDFNASSSFGFRKDIEPALVGLKLAESNGDVRVAIEDW